MPINPDLLVTSPTLQCPYVDKNGDPLANGTLFLYQDNSRTTFKNWYYQSGTVAPYAYIPLPNPMTLSAAGTPVDVNGNDILPMYYPVSETDNLTPQPYFIQAFDQFGTLQWTRENFPFSGVNNQPINTTNQVNNLLINNRFWRNNPINLNASQQGVLKTYTLQYNNTGNTFYYSKLAPSQHDGFSMPDFIYIKNNLNATESISFNRFSQTTTTSLTNDVIPEFYLNHNCTANGSSGETLKCYQFPVSLHVDSISNQDFTFTIQAQSVSGPAQIVVYLYQFLGTGVSSPAPVFIGQGTLALNTAWTKYTLQGFFPGDMNLNTSVTNDDAYYVQISVPMNTVFQLNIALPSIYLSNIIPSNEFQTYDQIDAVINSPRTGDIREAMNDHYYYGWIPLNDGTIGYQPNMAATYFPTARNNQDSWQLYNQLWQAGKNYDTGSAFNAVAQIYDTSGNPANYGSTAYADFTAFKSLGLAKSLGKPFVGSVPTTALTSNFSTTYTANQLIGTGFSASNMNGNLLITATTATIARGMSFQFTSSGSLPGGLAPATSYWIIPNGTSNTSFYVATSLANAQSGIFITYSSAGTGTLTMTSGDLYLTTATQVNAYLGMPITFTNSGGALPLGLVSNAVYYIVPCSLTTLCLATSFINAIQGSLILFSNAGSGTNTLYCTLRGVGEGEDDHQQLGAEVAVHTHTGTVPLGSVNAMVGSTTNVISVPNSGPTNLNINDFGASLPMNIHQAASFMNRFIKM